MYEILRFKLNVWATKLHIKVVNRYNNDFGTDSKIKVFSGTSLSSLTMHWVLRHFPMMDSKFIKTIFLERLC